MTTQMSIKPGSQHQPRRTIRFQQSTLNTVYRSLFQGSAHEAALRAYRAGGPSVEELTNRIESFRAKHAR